MQHASSWRLRDTLAATILFIASIAFTLWQNTRIAALWDLSYLLDSSFRISLGQVPYRDFPFAHAPLTFLLHAAIIRIFGRVYPPHIFCASIEAGAATLLTWRILLRILEPLAGNAWSIATALVAPLCVLGIYAIYPQPIYDSDCILAVLIALYLLLRAAESPARNAIAGAACVLPLFFKQNIGLPFLFITLGCAALAGIAGRTQRKTIAPQICFLTGGTLALATALLAIHLTAGLHKYYFWTIQFAAQRRLPGVRLILESFHQASLLWTIPAAFAALILLRSAPVHPRRWKLPAAFCLLAAPFLWTLCQLAFTPDADDRADQLLSLWPHVLLLSAALAIYNFRPRVIHTPHNYQMFMPIILLAIVTGAFLSQQLWGSTYALWPVLVLLIALLLTHTAALARPLAIAISATLLLCGALYATSHERLGYIHLGDDTKIEPVCATLPQLHGLSTPGPYIPAFEELVRVTNAEIPANDGILLLPGEAPFYFTTSRAPQFPVLLFDPATDPYTPEQTLLQARSHNIRWLIVTRNLQLTEPPRSDLPEVLTTLQQDFVPYRALTNYDIYRHR